MQMKTLRMILLLFLLLPMSAWAQGIDEQYQQAKAQLVAENWGAAADIYRAIIAADPGQNQAIFELSKLGLKLDDLKMAQSNIRAAIDLDQRNQEYRDYAGKIGAITNGLREAKRFHDNRDFDQAIRKYDELTDSYPDFATIYYRKGISLQGSGDLQEAIGAFRTAQLLSPASEKYTKALRALAVREYKEGNRYYKIQDWSPAEEHFEVAIQIDPSFDQAYYRLARTLGKQGLNSAALEVLDRGLKANPAYLPVYLEKGNILRGESQFQEAASVYRGALKVDPASYRAMIGLAQSVQSDNSAEAIRHLNNALELVPDDVTANELLGELFSQQEEWASAQPYLRKALDLKPADHLKLWRLAYVENNLGNFTEGANLARSSVRIEDKFQPGWYELGRARKELGENAGAIIAFKNAETGRDRATAADAARERKQLEARNR